jgi:DNA-binding GntR family transcriptional regulator
MASPANILRAKLEEEIITGVLKANSRLDEVSLAERFGVSRTPVREALIQLSTAGLVIKLPHKGNFVAEVGPTLLIEMFDVMGEFEAMAARLASRRASKVEIAAIRQAHQACSEAAVSGDPDEYYYKNEIFHKKILDAAHNSFLTEQSGQLHKRLKAFRRLQLRTRGRMNSSFQEHENVVNAIEAGDLQAAAEEMRNHVVVQGERFADLLATINQNNSELEKTLTNTESLGH